MAAETSDDKKTFFREPSNILRIVTCVVTMYAVWCVLLLILTVWGPLLKSQNYECGNCTEDLVASRLRDEARLVYLWSGLNLPACIVLLLELWRRKGHFLITMLVMTCVLLVIMVLTFYILWREEAQGIKEFENKYLALLPLTDKPENTQNQSHTICHKHNNVHRWQAEFKCCGLRGYQDWESQLPDSCLCDGEEDSSRCVGVGNSLVYEKPCLPTVLSLMKKRISAFVIIMIFWLSFVGAPITISVLWASCLGFIHCLNWVFCDMGTCGIRNCMDKVYGGEEMATVVFIRRNNNETGKENRNGGVVSDVEGGTNVEGIGREAAQDCWLDRRVTMIPLSEIRRLRREYHPSPNRYEDLLLCMTCRWRPSYHLVIVLEEDSLLFIRGIDNSVKALIP